jgi:acyl transferase domain-containing protein
MSDANDRSSAPLQPETAIAIIGMAGRYPGADTIDALWRNVIDKVEGIRFFSEEELLAAGVARDVLARDNYVRASGVLSDIAGFDAALFGISAREAEMMDPQHRLFLECCWEALEDAAIDPTRSESRIGVYAGCNLSGYLLGQLDSLASSDTASYMEALVANDKDYLTTRVSYRLNLRGPSVTVGTACSTSAVAVALACEALQAQSCDVVLAGGSCITVPHERGYAHGDGSDAVSLDGHCRAFDAAATGTAPSSGVGVVVLKRLVDALADGDAIYAVIRGYAVGNDGNDKVGYAAPSVNGHAETVAEALEFASVSARDIGYVEAHGTGTPMGDPIEIAALRPRLLRDRLHQKQHRPYQPGRGRRGADQSRTRAASQSVAADLTLRAAKPAARHRGQSVFRQYRGARVARRDSAQGRRKLARPWRNQRSHGARRVARERCRDSRRRAVPAPPLGPHRSGARGTRRSARGASR